MDPEHKRIVELGHGWEGSSALVGLSPADADLLRQIGAPVEQARPTDPPRIKGHALFEAGRQLLLSAAGGTPAVPPTPPPADDPDAEAARKARGKK